MSSIAVAKLGMGYVSAKARNSCGNCKLGDQQFADRMPPYNTATWRCKKGGFKTTALAVCNEHEPAYRLAEEKS